MTGHRRRGLLILAGGAVVAVVTLVLALVLPGGGPRPGSVASPGTTPSSAPSASSAPSPSPSELPTEVPSGRPAPSRPRVLAVRPASLLSTRYVEVAFGSGRTAAVLEQPGYVMGSCYTWSSWHQNTYPPNLPRGAKEIRTAPTRVVGRRWSWPGEVALIEALGLEPGVPSAHRRFLACSDAASPDFDPDSRNFRATPDVTTRVLRLGDEAAVTTVRTPLQTVSYATARLGRAVVVLAQRQSGEVTSDLPLVRALAAAVRKAQGLPEGEVRATSSADAHAATRALLGTVSLPLTRGERGVVWAHDAPVRWSTAQPHSLYCLSAVSSNQRYLTTTATPLERTWIFPGHTYDDPVDVAFQLIVAQSPDEATARREFQSCREHALDSVSDDDPHDNYDLRDVPDLGDEAYVLMRKPRRSGYAQTPILVRSGATFVLVWAHELDTPLGANPDGAVAVARAALLALG